MDVNELHQYVSQLREYIVTLERRIATLEKQVNPPETVDPHVTSTQPESKLLAFDQRSSEVARRRAASLPQNWRRG